MSWITGMFVWPSFHPPQLLPLMHKNCKFICIFFEAIVCYELNLMYRSTHLVNGEICVRLSQIYLFFRIIKTVSVLYISNIWQVSLQLSCGDTCQIWMWLNRSTILLQKKPRNVLNGGIKEQNSVTLIPRASGHDFVKLVALMQAMLNFSLGSSGRTRYRKLTLIYHG